MVSLRSRSWALLCTGAVLLWSCQVTADQEFVLDLQNRQHPDHFDLLNVGEQQLPLMISEPTVPLTRGVAILVNDASRYQTDHNSLAALAAPLNSWGWVTMQMPAPDAELLWPPLTTESPPEPEAASPMPAVAAMPTFNDDHVAQYLQQLTLQLTAVVERSRQYPGFFLVIAEGSSAAWLTRLYGDAQLEIPDGLVIVNPYLPERSLNNQLPELLAATTMPVLDLFTPFANPWSEVTRSQRQIAARKGLKLQYRQRELNGQAIDRQQYAFMAKEIYGWLTYLGW